MGSTFRLGRGDYFVIHIWSLCVKNLIQSSGDDRPNASLEPLVLKWCETTVKWMFTWSDYLASIMIHFPFVVGPRQAHSLGAHIYVNVARLKIIAKAQVN